MVAEPHRGHLEATGAVSMEGVPARFAAAVERQRDRWFVWLPVCLAAGIGGYFALPVEPHAAVFVVAAGVFAGLAAAALKGRFQPLSLFLAVVVAGFVLAKIRTEMVHHPELLATTGAVEVTGWVEGVETASNGRLRLVVRLDGLAGIVPEATPEVVRVSMHHPDTVPELGHYVALRGLVLPLPGPVEPGGYDAARALWFQGIGATVIGFGEPEIVAERSLDLTWSPRRAVEAVRTTIRDRIQSALSGDLAGFAAALIIGERGGIPVATQRALQVSGLAHILAISGLHMSLMAGSVFWLLRAGLALVPGLALNHPIKKWAASGTLVAGCGYLLISGAGIATQRAYIMLAVMCLAVLLDRPAFTLRNLALAGLFILVFTPEAVLSASFQMSFMAVMGLIAFYEAVSDWRRRQLREIWPQSLPGRIGMSLVLAFAAMAATTIVASVMTSLPAAYHFNRVAPYSLLANLLALPLVTAIIMPAAVVAVAAMPLGLEPLPLQVMGLGIGWVSGVAHWVAALPGAGHAVPGMPTIAALAMALGACWLCLWRERLRLAGIALVLVGLAAAPLGSRPDVLVERTAGNVALRNDDGVLVPAAPRRDRYTVENWLLEDGDNVSLEAAAARPGWMCADKICRGTVKGRRLVYLQDGTEAAAEPGGVCREADIVVTQFPLRGRCRDVAVRIGRFDVWRHGAHAVVIDGEALRVTTAAEVRGTRPWTTPPVPRRSIREAGEGE